MRRVVTVENGLDKVKQHLTECGYEVVDMENCLTPVEAVIYNGGQAVNKTAAHGPDGTMLINAYGLTPEAVIDRLETI